MNVATMGRSPAEIYDEKFVPALFQQWGPVVAGAAGVGAGMRVLDVACGTGALTLAAARLVGTGGWVAGLDANPDMLAVARRKSARIEWREGVAEQLPYPDASFDAVVSQFGLMFFTDRPQALSEMLRVTGPGGSLAVAVCGALERSPGYAAFAALLDRLFGARIGNAFRAPFVLGGDGTLAEIAAKAGWPDAAVAEHNGSVRFASIDELVSTERACVWTLGGLLDQAQFDVLLRESRAVLREFEGPDGRVRFDMPALIVTARRSG